MPLNINGIEVRVAAALKSFWLARESLGVRSGKTLDSFVDLITWIVHNNGLPDAKIITGSKAHLPGYFRPSKSWDVVVTNQEKLVAAIELKSIADSFGNNANNRSEEVLGSGIDIKEAFEENAFEGVTRLFTGYLIVVEDCPETNKPVKIQTRHFKAMKEFMADPQSRNELYVKDKDGLFPRIDGISYMNRFDILCKRLMQKNLYTAASVICSSRLGKDDWKYSDVSKDTSIKAFLVALASHAETIAAIE